MSCPLVKFFINFEWILIDIRHLCTKSSESMGVSSTVVGVAFCLGKCRCKNVLLCWRYFESPVRLILRERCSLTNNCVLGGNSSLDQTWNQLAMTSDNKTTTELSRWVFSRQYLTSATVWRFLGLIEWPWKPTQASPYIRQFNLSFFVHF